MIRATVITDGTSDRSLIPIIEWSIRQSGIVADLDVQWADLSRVRFREEGLAGRVREAIELYPCDILFIHRDAEALPRQDRVAEIARAVTRGQGRVPYVCVITVRMTEAWLLISENAIRNAASNPSGNTALTMPPIGHLEAIPDPKAILFDLLKTASGLQGRRLHRFNPRLARSRVTEYIDDFSPLRNLDSFRRFEDDLAALVRIERLSERLD